MNENINHSRRRALRLALLSAATVPAGHWLLNKPVMAQDGPPQLSPDDPTAAALGYVHDTTTVDKAANPNHEPSQMCSNCVLIQSEEGDWRPCAIFPGKNVNANGWCKSWAPKAS